MSESAIILTAPAAAEAHEAVKAITDLCPVKFPWRIRLPHVCILRSCSSYLFLPAYELPARQRVPAGPV